MNIKIDFKINTSIEQKMLLGEGSEYEIRIVLPEIYFERKIKGQDTAPDL
ncbi:hypothetical protein [Acetivibrio mesophilus]|nr:hypothetical protein [Acetivibrio mesophilus]HHV30566.1 hypothetical protein [Clostridium sp.]